MFYVKKNPNFLTMDPNIDKPKSKSGPKSSPKSKMGKPNFGLRRVSVSLHSHGQHRHPTHSKLLSIKEASNPLIKIPKKSKTILKRHRVNC